MNKKGRKIHTIEIDKKSITAYDEDGHTYKLTRSQRTIFLNKIFPIPEQDLLSLFNNPEILSKDFRVIEDGRVIYPK